MSFAGYASLGLKSILVTFDGPVAIVTINRPQERNTFGGTLPDELVKVFDLFDRDDRVRVVILTADPTAPAYCSGADISSGWGGLFTEESLKEGPHAHRDSGGIVAMAIFRCRKITIAAVNGHAVGVGVTGLQLPFDFRFAWEDAKLALPFVRRGITPEATSTYLLPHLVGHAHATALLLTGGTSTPKSPHLAGLYHAVLPARAHVLPAALAFAQELAANTSQPAVACTKALLWRGARSIEAQHLLDSRALRELAVGRDAAEGARAFKERRAPRFGETLSQSVASWMPWWREVDVRHRLAKL
ncbi:hypothetical protein HETIRDRAFT_433932 [Heterobasidion irregulare TC 32-1]|uniref:Enoyl-CoA hydratase/isomerase n=1 Tax=Heterobasidion irregulare (strain TC 32-1) TaxID=747525 RepID=W4KC64_HETIT|nr:uncharacterized protein HETIRDRAFT_433932 [Heterobasidion irregulare TC 32-1]ETW83462.1 hypothetical protein HETIRDRAFT_433932 [Heterobasidion irregulare TC 32-1]